MPLTMKRPATLNTNAVLTPGKSDHIGPVPGRVVETVSGPTSSSTKGFLGVLPPFSKLDFVLIQCAAAGTISTGTHLGIGTAGDPDAVAEETFTGIDAVGDKILKAPDGALISGASPIPLFLNSLNGSGAKAGDITAGTWDIALFYSSIPVFEAP